MLDLLLPQRIDNTYRGQKLALWLFVPLLIVKLAMGLNVIFNGHVVAISADGIPLDSYTPAGARAVLAMFALWGLSQVLMGLLGVLTMVRYRAMVPIVLTLFMVEHLSRKLIFQFLPIDKIGTPPGGLINLVFLTMMMVGLALSLWRRSNLPTE